MARGSADCRLWDNHAMSSISNITGLVLAGGLGRRMGGVDKGLQLLDGRRLIDRVIERLAPQVDTLLVNANRNLDVYAELGHPLVVDRFEGFVGPLAGIHAGLTACTTPWLAVVPCDAPFLPLDLVVRLRAALESQAAHIAVARTADGLQPTFALMHRDALASLTDYLATGGRRLRDWYQTLPLAIIDFADAEAFTNLNSPAELAASSRV